MSPVLFDRTGPGWCEVSLLADARRSTTEVMRWACWVFSGCVNVCASLSYACVVLVGELLSRGGGEVWVWILCNLWHCEVQCSVMSVISRCVCLQCQVAMRVWV